MDNQLRGELGIWVRWDFTATSWHPDALAKPTASTTDSGARSVSTSFAGGKTLYVEIDEFPWLVGPSTSTSVLGPTDEAGIAFGTGARRSLGSNEQGEFFIILWDIFYHPGCADFSVLGNF